MMVLSMLLNSQSSARATASTRQNARMLLGKCLRYLWQILFRMVKCMQISSNRAPKRLLGNNLPSYGRNSGNPTIHHPPAISSLERLRFNPADWSASQSSSIRRFCRSWNYKGTLDGGGLCEKRKILSLPNNINQQEKLCEKMICFEGIIEKNK